MAEAIGMASHPPWFPPEFEPAAWTLRRPRRGRLTARDIEPVILALGAQQHATVARVQLLHVGVSTSHIESRLSTGALRIVYPGTYAVSAAPLAADGRRMAGVLACGEGAQLAGRTGALHAGVLPEGDARLDVAIPSHRRLEIPGLALVRAHPRPEEQTLVRGVPTHTVARILLDLARRDDSGEILEWAWRQSVFLGLLDIRQVRALLDHHGGRPDAPALRGLYERRRLLVGELRSRFEAAMLPIIRGAGLPEPLCNVPWDLGGGLVLRPDFRIPELKLVVEADGRDGHADVEFLLTDDERDAAYARHGYGTLRYSVWEAKRQRERVDGELRAFAATAAISGPGTAESRIAAGAWMESSTLRKGAGFH